MTDKEIVERAKKAEKETVFGELVHSPISRGVNSAYGIGFIEGMVEYRNSLQEEPVSKDFEMALAEMVDKAQRCVVEPWVIAAQWKEELIKLAKSEEPVSEQNPSNVEKTVKKWKEPVSIDFEHELYKAFGQVKDFTLGMRIAKWFYDMGKNSQEPVSEGLEKAARKHSNNLDNIRGSIGEMVRNAYKAGAKWKKANLWKSADGDDLPEIDREVIAILDNSKVVFAHRPPEYWDGKNIITGKVTRNYPKTYDKGGWNIPDVKFWLDVELPKEIEL